MHNKLCNRFHNCITDYSTIMNKRSSHILKSKLAKQKWTRRSGTPNPIFYVYGCVAAPPPFSFVLPSRQHLHSLIKSPSEQLVLRVTTTSTNPNFHISKSITAPTYSRHRIFSANTQLHVNNSDNL